jgi:hypothetical protein
MSIPAMDNTEASKEKEDSEDTTHEQTSQLLAHLGRPFRAPPPPMSIRATSDGGNYVRYSGEAIPIAPRKRPPEPPRVLIAEAQEPLDPQEATVILPRRTGHPTQAAWVATASAVAWIWVLAIGRTSQAPAAAVLRWAAAVSAWHPARFENTGLRWKKPATAGSTAPAPSASGPRDLLDGHSRHIPSERGRP